MASNTFNINLVVFKNLYTSASQELCSVGKKSSVWEVVSLRYSHTVRKFRTAISRVGDVV